MAPTSWIAKPSLDIGLFTNQLDPMLAFWGQTAGIHFDHMLPVGNGIRQYRHLYGDAVLKVNHARTSLLAAEPGGYYSLVLARDDVTSPVSCFDPDHNAVKLVPKGWNGLTHWAIETATPDADTFLDFYNGQLGLPLDTHHPLAVRCGESLIIGRTDTNVSSLISRDVLQSIGYRYVTIQVWDVDREHGRVLAHGAREGAPPRSLGETARISFLRDKSGNWIELSQRASVTGSPVP
ncbi:VOC family protein [Hyphomonas oceanitis]|uniref:Glyoxalase/bleomycin resistance protein/dioxygenase n=1 Tax=Hyphomonas oceanitis SCH89 TaxID=1280953 RepID=A0A059G298_9PROT|nr:VOC family protein [Hyphomonas oceanitis]KDA00906.1 glyoxalase/bleomycin resistance protein/dioxygenase [Hyphomonas oceanitis SCH89]